MDNIETEVNELQNEIDKQLEAQKASKYRKEGKMHIFNVQINITDEI